MNKLFGLVQGPKIKRTAFDLSHERKLSARMGALIPVLCQEVVPGDTFDINSEMMIRFAPLTAPLMHRINAYIHYFFVPNRIIWSDWEQFITGQKVTSFPSTHMQGNTILEGKLADHLGIPIGTYSNASDSINTLPFRAYYQIWNDYYRDENLQTAIDVEDIESDANMLQADCLSRAWEKDYFTSALPWTQKGTPVAVSAQIELKSPATLEKTTGGTPTDTDTLMSYNTGELTDSSFNALEIDAIESIDIDINELRAAHRLQRWLERNARAGTRYIEHLMAHWGIKSSDARLQRAEYLGGGKQAIVISEVLSATQTNEFDSNDVNVPIGSMAGHGISVGRTNRARRFFEEHGYVMGILSVMPVTAYQQGLPKMFQRQLNIDVYFPEFAQLGEQEVKMKELYYQDNDTNNDKTFGYQSRWAEYKYIPSTVHGDFKTTLDYWTLVRKFDSEPALNEEFILPDSDTLTKCFAIPSAKDDLWIQIYHKITAIRPMPFFNNPTL